MTKLTQIEGISGTYEAQLRSAGVVSVEQLLEKGGDAPGRVRIAAMSGIAPRRVLEFVVQADLFRIRGVGREYADLLAAAGVDSVEELARRNAEDLAKQLAKANAEHRLVKVMPTSLAVSGWVDQAKYLRVAFLY